MNNRQAISKKTRFEVFKRDNFTCQYCGRKAPDVILEVDHIQPVSKGGKNDILNLVTSCKDCNRGKRDRKISEHKELDIQRKKLEELNERRNQLKMIKQWRDELNSIKEMEEEIICGMFQDKAGVTLRTESRDYIKNLLYTFDFSIVIDSVNTYINQYLSHKEDGTVCFIKPIGYIGGIAKNKTDERFNPNLFYERIFVSALVREDIIDRSEAKIAKRIVKGKIKSQEDLNCLLDSIEDVTDLQDIEDFIYDILY